MDLNQLGYFVALAESGSFTRAAEACHVSQPSLSQQIRKLEEESGQPLVERLARGVRLTEPGRVLLEQANKILMEVEATERRLAEQQQGEAGQLSIGVISTVAPYLLPLVLEDFRKQVPKAELTIVEGFASEVERQTAERELDLGITSLPVSNGRLESEQLFEEPLYLALPRRHELSRREEVRISDIQKEAFILLHEEHCLATTIERFCAEHGFRPKLVCRSAQLTTVQELIASGQGLSLLPAMVKEVDRSKERVYRQLTAAAPRRAIAVMWRRGRYRSRLAIRFLEHLKKVAKELEPQLNG